MALDPVRARLKKLIQERTPPTDYKAASLALGRNHAYLYQFIFKGVPKKLPEELIGPLAEYLGCSHAELRHEGPVETRGRPANHPVPIVGPSIGMVRIPEVDVRASAGPGAFVDAPVEVIAYWDFPESYVLHDFRARPENLRVVTVDGDSMEPELMSGDRVIIDVSRRGPSPPGIFVIWDGFGVVVKRVEYLLNSDLPKISISSANKRYSSYERSVDEVNIIGRVIWYARQV
ncbi:Peptidase S24-like [uncultured Gammaproteobacteria bacterium]